MQRHLRTLTTISVSCFMSLNLCSEASFTTLLPPTWLAAADVDSDVVLPMAAALETAALAGAAPPSLWASRRGTQLMTMALRWFSEKL